MKNQGTEVNRAFTVKPLMGWLIMKGIKDVENRTASVLPRQGTCVVSFSKNFSRSEYEGSVEAAREDSGYKGKLPTYEELLPMCGKAVGIVKYDVQEASDSPWYYEGNRAWLVSKPKWFKKPFAVTGFIGMWKMKPGDIKKVKTQI